MAGRGPKCLPVVDDGPAAFGRCSAGFDRVRDELLEAFGGVTLFSRSPAEGMWAEGEADGASRDRLITIEVITEAVDRAWWANYRAKLQECFLQEEVLIRSYQITKL